MSERETARLFVVEDASIVGRIHAMLADLHRQGRVSCAEVALIHALTQDPGLPDSYRLAQGGAKALPRLDVSALDGAARKVGRLRRELAALTEAVTRGRGPLEPSH